MTIYSKCEATPETRGAYKVADGYAYFQHEPGGRKATDEMWDQLISAGCEVSTFPLDNADALPPTE